MNEGLCFMIIVCIYSVGIFVYICYTKKYQHRGDDVYDIDDFFLIFI
jgi:hypothetical protein